MPLFRGIFFYLHSMKQILFFGLFLLYFFPIGHVFGQQEEDTTASFYREDQLYLGINYLVLSSSAPDFEQQGLSRSLYLGFLRDIPLHRSGQWAVAAGIGYEHTSMRTNLLLGTSSVLRQSSIAISRMGYHSISFPIELRWRNATPTKYAFWRIYAGLQWNRIWQASGTPKGFFRTWHPISYLSLGYNTWNIHLSYSLQSLYPAQADAANDLQKLGLGLIFYVF